MPQSPQVAHPSPMADNITDDTGRARSKSPQGSRRNSTSQYVEQEDNQNHVREREMRRQASPADAANPPVKRSKRGKYISRACTSCQRRKIKCEGGDPCAQCIARKRPCISLPRGRQNSEYGTGSMDSYQADNGSIQSSDDVQPMHHEILSRLADVELKLSTMSSYARHDTAAKSGHGCAHNCRGCRSVSVDEHHSPTSAAEMDKVLEADGQMFAGEVSINLAFDGIAATVLDADAENATSPRAENKSTGQVDCHDNELLRGPRPKGDSSGPRKVRGWLETLMESQGIVPNEDEWRRSLTLYFDEVYILYPILHPPSVWNVFNGMWENSALWNMSSPREREQKRLSVAMVCFCLALSRCSVPTRRSDADGVHSAGWGLYSVGVSLMQDAMGLSSAASKSLLTLQLLLLRVLYLFRLDANQAAARILAAAIANGHIMGLHRQSTLERLPVFASQMYCRSWWCLYVLDRRIALESGQPFLIQDANIDTPIPLELSDDWLTNYAASKTTAADPQVQAAIAAELELEPYTPITYLQVRIRFSRIIGKAWELLYGIRPKANGGGSSAAVIEYTDTMLCRLLDKMPPMMQYDPSVPLEAQSNSRPRWVMKQAIVLYTVRLNQSTIDPSISNKQCCTFLRLLIQTLPLSAPRPSTPDQASDDELESITICASLAAGIMESNSNLSDEGLKYNFPISHYLTSATMVMATLVAKEPSLKKKYAGTLLAATQSLHIYCNKIWVSGKMMQWVSRLGVLVKRALSDTSVPALKSSQQPGITSPNPLPDFDFTMGLPTPGSKSAKSRADASAESSTTPLVSWASNCTGGNGESSSAMESHPQNEMNDWMTSMPTLDLTPIFIADSVMDMGTNATSSSANGFSSMSVDLMRPLRSTDELSLGIGNEQRNMFGFGPLGHLGLFGADSFGFDLDANMGTMEQTLGLDTPLGI